VCVFPTDFAGGEEERNTGMDGSGYQMAQRNYILRLCRRRIGSTHRPKNSKYRKHEK
jgi:hypothetical protein